MSTKRGFTLIELLIVMAIILILAGLLTPGLFKAKAQANKVSCANNLKMVGTALEVYWQSQNTYPATVTALSNPIFIDDTNILKCPIGLAYTFTNVPTPNTASTVEIIRCTSHPSSGTVSLYKGGYIKVQ